MKILFVSQYFYPESFRGNELVFDFVKRGFDVTVLTAKPNYPSGKFYDGYSFFNKRSEVINGVKVIRTPIFPRGKSGGLRLIINYISFVFFSFFAVIFRIDKNYDAVFVQQLSPVTMALPGIWAKKRSNCPMYLWVLDLWPESVVAAGGFHNSIIINILDRIVKYIYDESSQILISSKSFEDSIRSRLKNKNKVIHYFPNWAEDTFTEKLNNLKRRNLPVFPKGFNILFAGNMGEAQDFESILTAIHRTKNLDLNWVFVGDGRKASWFKKQAELLNLKNVFLFGRYSIDAMPYFFNQANAMLVTLKNEPIFRLTVPAKIQAYMASSKLIVGMLDGEGQKLVNESNSGLIVNAGDVDGLVESIEKLIQLSVEERTRMENSSLEYYTIHFSKENLFNQLENIFKNG